MQVHQEQVLEAVLRLLRVGRVLQPQLHMLGLSKQPRARYGALFWYCYLPPNLEQVRRDAVIATLERTKNAFRPKLAAVAPEPDLTTTKHHKGCHCRKSNCLKKYCECFQSGVPCSELCRCVDCKNHSSHDPDYYDDGTALLLLYRRCS